MGRGEHLLDEAVIGPDGALYRRGRRRVQRSAATGPVTEMFTVAKLSNSGSQQLRFLRKHAEAVWTVASVDSSAFADRPWRLTNPLGEVANYFASCDEAVERAREHLSSSDYGGRVHVADENGSGRYLDFSGRQTGWHDPLHRYEFDLMPVQERLLSPPRRRSGTKIAISKIGMTVGWVPQKLEDRLEQLLDAGLPHALLPVVPDDPGTTELRLQIVWQQRAR